MHRKIKLASVAAAISLLAACGGDGATEPTGGASPTAEQTTPDPGGTAAPDNDTTPAGDTADDQELQSVTVGTMPLVDLAPLYLGDEKGFFAEEGLELTFEVAQGGAAIVPSVISGEMEFGFSNPTSLILAHAQGLPVKLVAPAGSSTGEVGSDYAALVVMPDSGISTAADLEDKTVAVNTLRNIAETNTRQSVRVAGGDPDQVTLVELAMPDMPAALNEGQVDAVFVAEPFLTISRQMGAMPIAWTWIDVSPDLLASAYFTSEETLQEKGDLVDRFQAAIAKSAAYAQDNPDEVRDIMTKFTQISPELLDEITLPRWTQDVNLEALQAAADVALDFGLIDESVDVSELVAD